MAPPHGPWSEALEGDPEDPDSQDVSAADFEVVQTADPDSTVRALQIGEAECALVSGGDLARLREEPGPEGEMREVHVVWTSGERADALLVAFPSATGEARASVVDTAARVCADDGAALCERVGIARIRPRRGIEAEPAA